MKKMIIIMIALAGLLLGFSKSIYAENTCPNNESDCYCKNLDYCAEACCVDPR